MKTLNLKFGDIKEMLSKDQMKLISGGSCTFYWNGNDGYCWAGSSVVEGDQQGADNICEADDCCDNVDCT